jgi:hypothetical protein
VLLGTVVVLAGAAAQAAGAAIFNVSTAAQLEAAVDTANGNGQHDTINLAAGVYPISNGLVVGERFATRPTNVHDLTIRGSGGTTAILANDHVNVERTTLTNHELGLWTSTGSAT